MKGFSPITNTAAMENSVPTTDAKLERLVPLIDRASFWILGLGTFALPLVYLRTTHDEFVLPKLLFANLLLGVLLALRVIRWAASGAVVIRRTPLDFPVIAFLASAVVATIFSVNRNVSIFGMYIRYEGVLTLTTYVLLFWLSAQILTDGNRARTLLRVMLVSGLVLSIIAVVQWVLATLTMPAPAESSGFGYAGLPRASATMSNPTMLAAFLAMLVPIGIMQLVEDSSLAGRILGVNAILMMSLGLALTFERSGWLGCLVGAVITVAAPQRTRLRIRLGISAATLIVIVSVVLAAALLRGGTPLVTSLMQRAASISFTHGSGQTRVNVWSDSLRLIANRPVTGYGPDTFGMVYPPYRTAELALLSNGKWGPNIPIDKSPSEPLQIAATQGILGLACYLWILLTCAVAFWRGRHRSGAAAAIGGIVAYQVWALGNFSWAPAALPYWIFLGAAVRVWSTGVSETTILKLRPAPAMVLALPIGLAVLSLVSITAVREWSADTGYQLALDAETRGDWAAARANASQARSLAPENSQYAFEDGRVYLESADLGGKRWLPAHESFSAAARLGTFYSAVYYDLALTDIQLGRPDDAVAALHQALRISANDPASLTLLQQIESA